MITLKNGENVEYREDFDEFFRNMVRAVIKSSLRAAGDSLEKGDTGNRFDERLLREIMDNCIYITRQFQELARGDEKLFSMLVTGCLFNCMILSLSKLGTLGGGETQDGGMRHYMK